MGIFNNYKLWTFARKTGISKNAINGGVHTRLCGVLGRSCRVSQSIDFVNAIRQLRQGLTCHQNIIVAAMSSCMCKLIRFHKRVVFVDENNAVLHLRQITLPVFTRKHTARDITIYRYAAALPPAAHTEKRGRSTSFPRRTLSLQNSKIPTYGELDLNLVVSHHYRMLALHRTSPRRQSAAIKTSSSIVWTT